MNLTIRVSGTGRLSRQLDALAPDSSRERRNIARRMGREVRKYSRKNIRRQQSVDGVPFPPRRDKRDKRKLLQSIGKRLEVIGGPDSGVLVSWKEALWGTAAYRNQHGVGKDWTPAGPPAGDARLQRPGNAQTGKAARQERIPGRGQKGVPSRDRPVD